MIVPAEPVAGRHFPDDSDDLPSLHMVRVRREYRLLIADDDPGFRETLRFLLDPYFYTLEAGSGEEAIRIAESCPVHVALLDMHMRVLTGLDTLRVLKSINAAAPCILITADATDELRRDAHQAEAFSVLSKPVRKAELVTTVSTALQQAYQDPDVSRLMQA